MLAAEIAHAGWRAAAVELGGRRLAESTAGARERAALREIRDALEELPGLSAAAVRRWPSRSQAPSSANGSWRRRRFDGADLDLARVVPVLGDVPFVAGNDATLAGLAEARRGVAAGVPVVLYLSVEVGIGGVLLVGGRPLLGALGEAGSSGTCRSAIPRGAARAERAGAGISRSTAVRSRARSAGVHLAIPAGSPSGRSRRPNRLFGRACCRRRDRLCARAGSGRPS